LANSRADRGTQHQEEVIMKMSVKAMMLSAAITGLLGGTSSTLNASPTHAAGSKVFASGLNSLGRASFAADKDKHSCKGKNDCKGQGGCKSSDNGCKGKNSCKGKGGCATDGSKPPKF
jgi:hypothetical protein